MIVNLSETIVPRSDQINADDLIAGPRVVTIESVTQGTAEQPVNVHLVDFPGRPFRPSKTVRRILVAAWGPNASEYAGRRMTIYRDPTVKFGGAEVGGIRVSHLSHIEKRITLAVTVTRGKRAAHSVDPLPDAPEIATVDVDSLLAAIETATTEAALKELWDQASTLPDGSEGRRAASELIKTRIAEVTA